ELSTPWTTAATTRPATQTGAKTSSERRHGNSGKLRLATGSPSARTRSRTAAGAAAGKARSSRTTPANSRSKSIASVAGITHHLLESFQGSAQPSRAGGWADAEDARCRRSVQLQQDTQLDDLP